MKPIAAFTSAALILAAFCVLVCVGVWFDDEQEQELTP